MPGYIYILRSEKTGRHYVGSTIDPDNRLARHNAGAVAATRGKGPWSFAKTIEFPDATTARKAEYYLKRQKSKIAVDKAISGDFAWPDELTPLK